MRGAENRMFRDFHLPVFLVLGVEMSFDEIAAQYKSAKTVDRIEAVNRMKRLPVPDRGPLLMKAIRDKSNFVATMAAEQLGRCADYSATNEMLAHFHWQFVLTNVRRWISFFRCVFRCVFC